MDFVKLKEKFEPEETKYDWETLKSKFEPETEKKDWESLKAKFEPEITKPTYQLRRKVGTTPQTTPNIISVGVGLGAGIGVKEGISLPQPFNVAEGIPQETTLKPYTPPKKTIWNKIKGIFEAKPEEQLAKAQVSYNISQKTGIPITEVNQNLDKITKQLGIRGIPTTEEMISVAMILNPITAGLITTKPISVVTGVAKWMGLTEGVNAIVSKLKGIKYKPFANKKLSDLTSDETAQWAKDSIDILEMIGKIAVITATDKNVAKIWNMFTKDITTEYGLPEKMYLSADKIRSLHGTLNAEEYTQFEQDIYARLGNKADVARKAFIEGGVDIEIPATEMTTFADRPWFAKLKEAFGIKPFSQTVINYAGEVKPVIGLLEGKIGIPEVSKVIPKVGVETPTTKVSPTIETTPKTVIPKELEPLAEEAIPRGYKQFLPAIKTAESIIKEYPNEDIRVIGSTQNLKRAPLKEREARSLLGVTKARPDLDIVLYNPEIEKFIQAQENQIDFNYHDTKQYLKKSIEGYSNLINIEGDTFFKAGDNFYKWTTVGLEWIDNPELVNVLKQSSPIKQVVTDFYTQATAGVKAVGKAEVGIPVTEKTAVGEGQALSAKKWQVNMEKEAVIPEKINKTEIMNWTEKTFGVPLKGKVTHRWKSAGVYYPKQQIVRMEKWGELSVLTHEVAHDIDAKLKKSLGLKWRFINKEITKELVDLDYDQSKNGRRTSEGFAEYMRYRMTTGQVEQLAPKFNEFFNKEILNKNPILKANLEGLKKRMDIWSQQGAENRIIEHIDWKGEHTEIKGVTPKLNKAIKFINEKFNDEFYVAQKITKEIETVIGRKIPPSKNPATMMEYYKSKSGAVARTFVKDKAIDEYGNVVGPGLSEILKVIPNEDMKSFIIYATSKRALDLAGRNIESGFDIDDVKFIIDKYKGKGWDKTAKELTDWSGKVLDWVVRAGGLDKETAQLMRDLNPIYLPFKRTFIDELGVIKGVGGYVDTGKGIYAIKGSGRPIINPIESMVSQARVLIAKSMKIRIANLFINLAEEEGIGGFITRVPAPIKPTTFNASQIKDYINDITGYTGDFNDFLTVFTQDFKYNGKENIVSVWKNGKQEFYEIHPDLYEALKGVDPLKLNAITKILAPFSRMLRLGATGLKVSFGLARNPFRDAFTYAVFSKRNNVTVFDPIKGYYKDIVTKPGETTWRFKKLGGGLSGQIGLDRSSIQNTYDEMLSDKLGLKGKVLRVVKHPVTALSDILSITEMGPRSVEVESAYKKYTSENWKKSHPDWTEEDAFVQAFNDAQDITVNFTKSGKWAKQINQATAFFNVAIRGPEKLYRSFRERPIQTFVKGILWCTLLAVGSWYQNKDKEWYKNLPPTYKYSNLFFEVGGNVYRLPIPFELGIIFMSIPQAALDSSYTAQTKREIWVEGILKLAEAQIPDPIPSVFGPLIDVAKNKNYLGIPIESEGMQYLYPSERKKDYTSKLAVGLSKGMNEIGIQLSPIQLDYLMDSYSGGFGKQFKITGDELVDYPIIGDLILRDPYYPKRQLNNFFSDWENLKQKKQSNISTKDELRKLNKIDGFYNTYKLFQKLIKKAKEKGNKELLIKYENQLRIKLEAYGYK